LQNGRLDMVQWLLENDCPHDETMFAAAYDEGHYDVLNWLEEEGYNG
jgi:aromatic ring-cleaving dioxygenase